MLLISFSVLNLLNVKSHCEIIIIIFFSQENTQPTKETLDALMTELMSDSGSESSVNAMLTPKILPNTNLEKQADPKESQSAQIKSKRRAAKDSMLTLTQNSKVTKRKLPPRKRKLDVSPKTTTTPITLQTLSPQGINSPHQPQQNPLIFDPINIVSDVFDSIIAPHLTAHSPLAQKLRQQIYRRLFLNLISQEIDHIIKSSVPLNENSQYTISGEHLYNLMHSSLVSLGISL